MLKRNFAGFLQRHRFNIQDVLSSSSVGMTRQDFILAQCFPANQLMGRHFGGNKLTELNRSFAVAEYMAGYETDQPEGFARYTSFLSEEGWAFALRFCPYHKIHTAFENLDLVHSALIEASLALNSASAGMEAALDLGRPKSGAYEREKSKATASLLNFSALYASYIDICRRIRKNCRLEHSSAYDRAIVRILGKNLGEHRFVKDLRNFILHYHLVEPEILISLGKERSVKLLLDSNSLLFGGFKWSPDARDFIYTHAKLNVLKTTAKVAGDIARLISFHRYLADKKLPIEKSAYGQYRYERTRFQHLQKSEVDLGAIFKRPTTILSRLLDENTVAQTINSSMPDNDVMLVLCNLANRHQNLSDKTKSAISIEVAKLLKNRPLYLSSGAFLQGREIK